MRALGAHRKPDPRGEDDAPTSGSGHPGGGDHDWLKARHHFAVDRQGNPAHAHLGNLVAWNDDEIAPHSGFPMHGHRDMEIVTYVPEGILQHKM